MTFKTAQLNLTLETSGFLIARRISLVLCGFVVLLLFFYMYFVGNIVFNIVARKTVETSAHLVSSEIADLEVAYLSLTNTIDMSRATALGFSESKNIYYAKRIESSKNLSWNDTRHDL